MKRTTTEGLCRLLLALAGGVTTVTAADKGGGAMEINTVLHAAWPIDRDYMAPPSHGKLASFDPALLVTPPAGFEVGYVPIVITRARSG
jgi:hypothetical protein